MDGVGLGAPKGAGDNCETLQTQSSGRTEAD